MPFESSSIPGIQYSGSAPHRIRHPHQEVVDMRASHLGESCTVLIEDQALDEFLEVAVGEYQRITSETPLPCFALLVGSADDATFTVERVAFGRNARTTDPAARREF